MTDLSGYCLCSSVKVVAFGTMLNADACHCAMCRRQNAGGAFYAAHFDGGVRFQGEHLRWYAASEHGERAFCSICGSTLGWRLKAQPEHIGVSLGLFDTVPGRIGSRIFTEEAGGYTILPHDVPHKTGEQVLAEFAARQEQADDQLAH